MTDTPDNAPRRRVVRRRGGLSSGGLHDSTLGVRTVRDEAEDDADLDLQAPEDLNAAVIDAVPRISEEREAELIRSNANNEEYTPANRLAQVRTRSSEYEKEYRLELLHRLLMRKLPLDEIAAAMGVSVSTIVRYRTELRDRMRAATKDLDVETLIGNSKGFYEEVQAMAMRAASSSTNPMPMRLAAMRTALASHNDMHRFFQAAGVYDVLRFRKGAGDGAETDIQRLMALTDELLLEARRGNRGEELGDFSNTDAEVLDL